MKMMSLMQVIREDYAKKVKQSGSMIAFFMPRELGLFFKKEFKDISGDLVEPKDQHITLGLIEKYSGKEKKINTLLNKLAATIKPFDVIIDGYGVFPPHESNGYNYVLYAEPKAQELREIHSFILPEMQKYGIDINNGSHDFKPHITIKYCKEKPDFERKIKIKILIKDIYFAIGERRYRVKLG